MITKIHWKSTGGMCKTQSVAAGCKIATIPKQKSTFLTSFEGFNRRSHRNASTKVRNFTTSSISSSWMIIGLAGAGAVTVGAYIYSQQNDPVVAEEKPALDPQNWKKFKLKDIIDVNHNTKIFRFSFDSPTQQLGMPVASYILVKGPLNGEGKPVIRPYTPITYDEKGYFDLMIKKYPAGPVSSHIHSLKKGDFLEVKGPNSTIPYKANEKKQIGMIAGGTGITPMLQVLHEILKNPQDKTEVSLVFANIAYEDILLKDRLDKLAKEHKNFKVYYVLEKPPANWNQGVGYVSEDVLRKCMPKPSKDNLIMVCGPNPMLAHVSGTKTPDYKQGEVKGLLKNLGYSEENVWKF